MYLPLFILNVASNFYTWMATKLSKRLVVFPCQSTLSLVKLCLIKAYDLLGELSHIFRRDILLFLKRYTLRC